MFLNVLPTAVGQLVKYFVVASTILAVGKSPPPPVGVQMQGTVALVMADRVTLASRTEKRTFVVPRDALIYVNRQEANLDSLMPGQFASVSGTLRGGQLTAHLITASRQY